MKIDEISLSIIRHLRDGRKSFKRIAEELGVTENTVRARVKKLTDERVLEVAGLVDAQAIRGHKVVVVGVRLHNLELVTKAEEFSKLKGVISVAVVTGRFDLLLTVLLKDEFDLLEFYTDQVSAIKDVESVETFVVYKSFKLRVPYIF
jgi:Lrp/AsnC family transcriptional regulator, regulator for asnA, asnC and gidA